MGLLRNGILVLLVVLLAVDLAAANAVVATDRTVLNPGFVTTTLEEENAYAQAEPLVLEQLPTEQLEETERLPIDPEPVVSAAVDPGYLRSQVEPNVERTLAYLHGNQAELELVVDLEPAKSAILAAIEAELANTSPTDLLRAVGGGQELGVEARGVEIDLLTLAAMAENESRYRSERRALRQTIRDRVLTRLVDSAVESASNDELLGLVIDDYDPSAYNDSEKERLVDEREPAIRTAVRERIEAERGDEITRQVDQRLGELRRSIRTDVRESLNESTSGLEPAVAEPATDLGLLAVDGYLADMSHAAFSAEFEATTADLTAGVTTVLERELDSQVPDRIDLSEQLDPQARENLRETRRIVGIIDLLAIVLPITGLVLIGVIYLVSRSVAVTLIGGGLGLGLGGLPMLVGGAALPGRLRRVVAQTELPVAVGELVLSIVDQVLAAVVLQSAIVVATGLVLLIGGLLLRVGVIRVPGRGGGP